MDQIKIGKFIAECRKKNNLTQMQLAEKLNITDRAISKWENGKGMPDSSIMLDLCAELKISVNELLSGEMIDMREYDKKTEELLVELAKQDELKNKKLMTSMWTILITSFIFYIGILLLAVNVLEEGFLLGSIICASTVLFVISGFIALKFEVDAGYYECKNCHHKFTPTYKEAVFSMHMSTTRYLKCPECHKRSWAKKVMTK
ncbi:MAG: helix-turn-helix transcriptional regulator [Clostridia bacterium]|nr:helix-turn-helix transcriptional regulator [Clostridia bacterium]